MSATRGRPLLTVVTARMIITYVPQISLLLRDLLY